MTESDHNEASSGNLCVIILIVKVSQLDCRLVISYHFVFTLQKLVSVFRKTFLVQSVKRDRALTNLSRKKLFQASKCLIFEKFFFFFLWISFVWYQQNNLKFPVIFLRQTLYPRNVRYMMKKLYPRTCIPLELERIFGDFDARPPTHLIHFKWTFHVDISWYTPFFKVLDYKDSV